jgi:adenylylsulfate kinase
MYRESNKRSVLKAVSWRVCGSLATMGVVLLAGGSTSVAVMVGGAEALAKTILYFVHERAWDRVALGRKETRGAVLWFTGLPGSGKTTISKVLAEKLHALGHKVEILDGDIVRALFQNTGFSKDERHRHLRHMGFLAARLESHNTIVIASFVSPYAETRAEVREMAKTFVEIYLSTPLEECERRDPKGMYAKARRGEIEHFTGVSDPYEAPAKPEVEVDTSKVSVEEAATRIIERLGVLPTS